MSKVFAIDDGEEPGAASDVYWRPTMQLRWFRPPHAIDSEMHLEQLFERVTGERMWRPVPTVLAD